MYNLEIKTKDTRECRNCRQRVKLSDAVRVEGRWVHKDYCPEKPKKRKSIKKEPDITLPPLEDLEEFITLDEEEKSIYKDIESLPYIKEEKKTAHGYFILSSAVSNSYVVNGFLEAQEQYARFIRKKTGKECTIKIRPLKHHNRKTEDDIFWDSRISPYSSTSNLHLNNNVEWFGSLDLSPTKVNALTGLEAVGGSRSLIVPHSKVQLNSIATPQGELPKLMYTTGAVTAPLYSDKIVGIKASFHHVISAIIVEIIDDELFHVRHLHWKDDCFYDLDHKVTADGVTTGHRISLLGMGDYHVGQTCPLVQKATFMNRDSIAQRLKPDYVKWDDLLDFESRNHHHRHTPIYNVFKHHNGGVNVLEEVKKSYMAVVQFQNYHNAIHLVTASNHNEALDRWIREASWREDPENAAFYLETCLHLVRNAVKGDLSTNSLQYWFDRFSTQLLDGFCMDIRLLSRCSSFEVNGVKVGFHGDERFNGARGSIRAFAKTGSNYIINHYHYPAIFNGVYQSGTATVLDMYYARGGMSNWLNSHTIMYGNGKRSIYNIINGEYTSL